MQTNERLNQPGPVRKAEQKVASPGRGARRGDHAIQWIDEHTPEDANGASYTVDIDQ